MLYGVGGWIGLLQLFSECKRLFFKTVLENSILKHREYYFGVL